MAKLTVQTILFKISINKMQNGNNAKRLAYELMRKKQSLLRMVKVII